MKKIKNNENFYCSFQIFLIHHKIIFILLFLLPSTSILLLHSSSKNQNHFIQHFVSIAWAFITFAGYYNNAGQKIHFIFIRSFYFSTFILFLYQLRFLFFFIPVVLSELTKAQGETKSFAAEYGRGTVGGSNKK